MTFGENENVQNTLEWSLHASVLVYLCFLSTFQSFKPDTENNANLESYRAYAPHCLTTWHYSVKNTKFWSKICIIVNFKAPGSL